MDSNKCVKNYVSPHLSGWYDEVSTRVLPSIESELDLVAESKIDVPFLNFVPEAHLSATNSYLSAMGNFVMSKIQQQSSKTKTNEQSTKKEKKKKKKKKATVEVLKEEPSSGTKTAVETEQAPASAVPDRETLRRERMAKLAAAKNHSG